MPDHGFIRAAAASPRVSVADCDRNAETILALTARADEDGVAVLLFPELTLTGYTCADLFHQKTLQDGAIAALGRVAERSREIFSGVLIIGLPLVVDDRLFNCAAVVHDGEILGVIPKSYLPNYKEFYEQRWFAPAATALSDSVSILGKTVPFGTDLLFDSGIPGLILGVEICEDLWMPIPPSCHQAIAGASVLLNLSASNEVIGKHRYRRLLVLSQSGRCFAAYLFASCGVTESTTDVVFGGHCMIAENSTMLAETERFGRDDILLVADIDVARLRNDRIFTNSFSDSPLYIDTAKSFRRILFRLKPKPRPEPLRRYVDAHPFVPAEHADLDNRCREIFHSQVAGLAKRLEHVSRADVTIGISGGLDSTLAVVVTCKAFDLLGRDRTKIRAITMPGFGTTERTRSNAKALMSQLGASSHETDIRQLCLDELRALGHSPFGIELKDLSVDEFQRRLNDLPAGEHNDLVFENVQARMRMSVLMNSGFVIGTGDLSEIALGWTTYNGDHMSMYNPNCSIPKTLVKFLMEWAAKHEFDGEARRVLLDIAATKITPELLPAQGGEIVQETEKTIGPYELHDFFLYHFHRFGASPEKILYLAGHADFHRQYTADEIKKWLQVFIRRFFTNQFKRSCIPDGPKVGTVSLSPRSDWRMPSDARAELWLKWADGQEE